jgi:flavin-dependent dehydrogenase
VHLVSPTGYVFDAPFAAPRRGEGAVITRRDLDHALVERATAAGAALREGVTVDRITPAATGITVHCKGGEAVAGDLVFGCDGAPSVVRAALGGPRFPPAHTAVAVRGYFEGVKPDRADAFGIYWTRDLLPGYGWLFPLPDGRANVGVGIRMDLARARGMKVDELYQRFLESPWMRRELDGARPVGPARGHLLPLGSFAQRLHYDRALLLGDSAGFINPVTGEGIEFAMESGEIAAATVAEADRSGAGFGAAALTDYGAECNRRFAGIFEINWGLQKLFVSPVAIDLTLKAAARSQVFSDALLNVLGAELSWGPLGAICGALRVARAVRALAPGSLAG